MMVLHEVFPSVERMPSDIAVRVLYTKVFLACASFKQHIMRFCLLQSLPASE